MFTVHIFICYLCRQEGMQSIPLRTALMGAFHVVLRQFPSILLPLLGERICDVFLLQEQVSGVRNVGKHVLDVGIHPAFSLPSGDALCRKLALGAGIFRQGSSERSASP